MFVKYFLYLYYMAKYRKSTIKKRNKGKKTRKRGGGFFRRFWGGEEKIPVTEPITVDAEKTGKGAKGFLNDTFGTMKSMFSSKKKDDEDTENTNPNTASMMEEGKAKDIPGSMVGGKKKKGCGCSGSPSLIGGRRRKSRKGHKSRKGRKSRKGGKSKKSRKTKRR